ncbi:MAG: ABC transporter permease [Immundisolibacterales bacterium]|nr:ABC transporter permease [Immundisolibacterales bacterium]
MANHAIPHHPGLIGTGPGQAVRRDGDASGERAGSGAATPAAGARVRRSHPGGHAGWLIAPATLWLFVFLLVPLASIFVFSFFTSTGHGMAPEPTIKNYVDYFEVEGFFDPEARKFLKPSVFLSTLGTTFRFALTVMALCLLVGYPIAYFLALQVQAFKWQLALFLLCMVPFWTSYLIRAVAWLPMLGRRGLLNRALVELGIVEKPVSFLLYSEFGYTMALVQLYVVLCVGPIFFSLAKIDRQILEAARDMGASAFQIFREIIVPLSLPGVAIGMIFIFVMLMGEFASAVVVYGGKISTVGTVILNYYTFANYPFAAVNALMLMVAMMIGVIVILRVVDIRKQL